MTFRKIEAFGQRIVVSPPLDGAGLCSECWRLRRMAVWATLSYQITEETTADGLRDEFDFGRLPNLNYEQQASLELITSHARAFDPTRVWVIARDGTIATETILPRPDCRRCSPRIQRLGRCVSRQPPCRILVGVAAPVATLEVSGQCGGIEVSSALVANHFFGVGSPEILAASGKGNSKSETMASALGEAVERYSASFPPDHLENADLRMAKIPPSRIHGLDLSLALKGGHPGDSEVVDWIVAHSVSDPSRTVLVPAYLAYTRRGSLWRCAHNLPATTNGLACASTLALAVERAYAECIERHLFFCAWYGGVPFDLLSRANIRVADRVLIDELTMRGWQLRVLNCGEYDGVRVLALAAEFPAGTQAPCYALGVGAGPFAFAAACEELAQMVVGAERLLGSRRFVRRAQNLLAGDISLSSALDHALFNLLRPPSEKVSRRCIPYSAAAISPPYYVDVTPEDIRRSVGWHVARVIVPNTIPYHTGNAVPHLALARAGVDTPSRKPHPLC
jgi:ribosomal protein S12 methylthiotransferase accessory factor